MTFEVLLNSYKFLSKSVHKFPYRRKDRRKNGVFVRCRRTYVLNNFNLTPSNLIPPLSLKTIVKCF